MADLSVKGPTKIRPPKAERVARLRGEVAALGRLIKDIPEAFAYNQERSRAKYHYDKAKIRLVKEHRKPC